MSCDPQLCKIIIIVWFYKFIVLYHLLDIIYYICIITTDVYACYEKTLSVQRELAEMQKNRGTIVLMNARIIFMSVNACLRTVKPKTRIHVHI